ncbi:MAG TPA: AI-2E family transporter [Steroidobacteraceae bacterium]|nr:AI-2E family transporter [Steroidobacteraceae bacterium]
MPGPSDSPAHKTARYLLVGALLLLGGWMLQRFLPALSWAVVLAVATASLYDNWLRRFKGPRRHVWAAVTFTAIVGAIVVVPLIYFGFVAVRETAALVRAFAEAAHNGPPQLPVWLRQFPSVTDWVNTQWTQLIQETNGHVGSAALRAHPTVVQWSRELGVQILHRSVTLGFTLLTLFFVCLNRERLRHDVPFAARRLFGPTVIPVLGGVVSAIRATVDGIVLVAIAEGAIMAGVYALVSVPHPILLGAITGIFAMIPFAAPIVFGAVAVAMGLSGAIGGAITIVVIGFILLFIADHFVRPVIIGEGARLPFLWVLLGILGGVEQFGLVGLFLGPALMAALVSVWRSWVRTPVEDLRD